MNTYDPSDHICYVHLGDARPTPADRGPRCTTLLPGYANQSPRTRLQRRPGHSVGARAGVASLIA